MIEKHKSGWILVKINCYICHNTGRIRDRLTGNFEKCPNCFDEKGIIKLERIDTKAKS